MEKALTNGHHKPARGLDLPANLEEVKAKVSDLNRWALQRIRSKPLAVIAGALCLGFLMGRAVNRK